MFPQGEGVCSNPWLIFHVNKTTSRSWDMYSKLNGGFNIIVGITCGLLMAMKLTNALEKERR